MDEERYKHLCFYADIEYEACEKDVVERAAKATRNIGMNRNRGLGSVLVYQIREGMHWEKRMTPMQCFEGERNLEGYGEFRISNLENMRYEAAILSEKAGGKGIRGACISQASRTQGSEKDPAVEPGREIQKEDLKYCRKLLAPILAQNVYESLVSDYLLYRMDRVHLSASAIGRLILMLTESLESESEPEKAFTDFCRRIQSIKRDRERQESFRFLKEILLADDKSEKYAVDFGKMGAKAEERDIYIECFSEDAYNKMLLGLWGKYLMTILTYQKYQKKCIPGIGV